MATNNSSFLFFLFSFVLLLFLFGGSKKVAAHEIKELFENRQQQRHVITVSSLTAAKVCSTPSKGTGIPRRSLQVAHKYGPCSPLKKGNTKIPSLHHTLFDDQIRVKHIKAKIANHAKVDDSAAKLPINFENSLEMGNLVVKIGIGTPKQDLAVLVDTGSDLTWIQCKPCSGHCYSQQDPLFNPSKSSTYANISCGSNACKQMQSATSRKEPCITNNTCIYGIAYGDGSYSVGYFAREKLTLSNSDSFLKFRFGCGEENKGLFSPVDGLLGLGRNKVSMVSQTAKKYGKIFSYCLPSSHSSTGYLAFGNQTGTTSRIQYTQLLQDHRQQSFYFLNLTGISVGGEKLDISPLVFATSGTIIDSGTVITRLPPLAYSMLRSAFRQAMSKYSSTSAYLLLDTCYNLAGYNTLSVPTIVLHFDGGANLNVDESGILIHVNSTNYCLAFTGNDDSTEYGIIGIMQQQTYEVVYNVAEGKLGFGAQACR